MSEAKPFSNRRLDDKSRMKREFHVRICEGVGVRFPRATRPDPTVRDCCHAVNLRLTVGPVNFVR